jgi:hypothetical protein
MELTSEERGKQESSLTTSEVMNEETGIPLAFLGVIPFVLHANRIARKGKTSKKCQ